MDEKAPDAFRTISEAAEELDLPQHVLRFWESRFREIKPMKRGGGRRYYRPEDIDLLRGIRHLLYGEGYTIRGVQRILREQGIKFVQAVWEEGAPQPPHGNAEEEEEIAEEAASAAEMLEEESGLSGKLSSLIGRDLGDRRDDVAMRVEPPMRSAQMPRLEPEDRAQHRPVAAAAAPAAPAAPVVSPVAPAAAAVTAPISLDDEALHRLQSALNELVECRKLIEGAVARAD